VSCSAGVSPAISLISAHIENAGETPALRKTAFRCASDELHFVGLIRRENCWSVVFQPNETRLRNFRIRHFPEGMHTERLRNK
jgi:hypothetical protein